ncbi:MarR family winged helix-turn-helix transcriptional regulator [Clostridium sardiniense]|uniref:MarR family winged helix-turn-helix transcriptional regulator n=1 Tax=Clostridium sardiniense TaxID=29369 RepID=UPI003D3307C2
MDYIVENTIFSRLNRLIVKIKKSMAKELKPYDVTLEQWSLLTRLWKQDSVSQTELAIRTNKDLPTVTRSLNKLIKKGLIEKRDNPEDSRASVICLTKAGRELEVPLDSIAKEVELKITNSMELSELEIFKKLMKNISNEFDN